jgi:hypothetical protein
MLTYTNYQMGSHSVARRHSSNTTVPRSSTVVVNSSGTPHCTHNIFQEENIVSKTIYVSLSEISDLMDISEKMNKRDKTDLFASYGLNYSRVSEHYNTVIRLEQTFDKSKSYDEHKNVFWLILCVVLAAIKFLSNYIRF